MLHDTAIKRQFPYKLRFNTVQTQSLSIDSTHTYRPIHESCRLKAKFHYAIWSQTGSKLVADLQRAEIWPII